MRENTPPRAVDIDDEEGEVIHFDNDLPPEDMDDLEEVTIEELYARYDVDTPDEDDDDDDGAGARRRSPVPDMSQLTFEKHKGPVFGCSLHPQRPLAATGGEDDHAYVWNIQSGEVVHEITEHKDTVTEVHFSYDGNYLATGDMAGELFVHKLQENDSGGGGDGGSSSSGNSNGVLTFRKVWEFSMGDMAWMRWHRAANVLLAGSENGEVYMWRIPSGDCKILPGDGVRCGAGELTGDGKKLFAAYSNGMLKLWDLKSCTTVIEVDSQHPMSHQEAITTVACDKNSPLYMSGAEDGKILFCSNNGPVGIVEASGPVECVAFPPSSEMKIAASGTLHGQIAIWDYTKYSLRTLCDHPEMDDGITKLKWLSDYTLLVATIQGNIYAYDVRTGVRKFSLSGHTADIYEICYDRGENILLSVSEDYTAKIFNVPELGD